MLGRIARPLAFLIVVLLVILAGLFFVTRQKNASADVLAITGQKPQIAKPEIEQIPTIAIATPVAWGNATPTAPAGLKVQAFAQGLDHPRWLYTLPNGDVLVAEANSPPRKVEGIADRVMGWLLNRAGAGVPSANRITLLRDANGDGVAETRSVLISGLNSPTGMALIGNTLYVANTDAVIAFPYHEGDTKITAKPEKIVSLPGGGNHWARNLLASPDGRLLYVTVGSSSNIGERGMDKEERRAAIWEVYPPNKSFRIYAAGLRNPNGLAWEPHRKDLWTVVNERDMLGGDGPPDYLTFVDFGAFYGWPYSYWGGYVDKRVDERPDLLEYTRRPDYALGPHVAPLGLVFADGAKLGAPFDNGAFIALHGSWNRKPLSGYKVIYVPFDDKGAPAKGAKPIDVLGAFLDANGHARGRPAGLALDRTGALLVADDVGNRIWRVSAAR
ncbi:PQQ-dependent sugar dehydrogenase [Sphingomonas tabacisoli]|uniref:PQQ-dependent sugar dehydrogenase n=1 Tax=Sphingomonas tabacisoli TaxID=2249466 RepID=A0ABW4HYU4_9SPHN